MGIVVDDDMVIEQFNTVNKYVYQCAPVADIAWIAIDESLKEGFHLLALCK